MNQYTLDGVPLRDPRLRWFTDRNTGIRIIPARREPNLLFPGVDGNSYIPRAPYDPGSVLISLNVQGENYLDLRKNIEFLTGLFTQRGRLMVLREHYDGDPSNDRIAEVTLAGSVEPKMTSQTSALMSFVMTIPGVFWRSAEVFEGWTPAFTKAGTGVVHPAFELPTLYGGNAPIPDLMLKVSGGSYFRAGMTDPASGAHISIDEQVAADETILIDTANWNAIKYKTAIVGSANWDMKTKNATSVNRTVSSNKGVGSMFILEPTLNAEAEFFGYRIIGSTSGMNDVPHSGTAFLTYRGRKAYL